MTTCQTGAALASLHLREVKEFCGLDISRAFKGPLGKEFEAVLTPSEELTMQTE